MIWSTIRSERLNFILNTDSFRFARRDGIRETKVGDDINLLSFNLEVRFQSDQQENKLFYDICTDICEENE